MKNMDFIKEHKGKKFDIVITGKDGTHITLNAMMFEMYEEHPDLIFAFDKSRIVSIQIPADSIELTDEKPISYKGFQIDITESIF